MALDDGLLLAAAFGVTLVATEWGVPFLLRRTYDSATAEQQERVDHALPEGVDLYVSDSLGTVASSARLPGFGGYVVVRDHHLERLPDGELAALVAHEAGHLQKGHGWFGSVHAALTVVVVLGTLRFVPLPLAGVGFVAYTLGTSPLYASVSRRQEFAADAHAVRVTGPAGTRSLLERLQRHREERASATPPLRAVLPFGRYFSTHPSLAARMARVESASEERVPR